MNFEFGKYKEKVYLAINKANEDKAIERIWQHDYTLWSHSPMEITNRLGWLHLPYNMMAEIDRINLFADQVREDGFTNILLLGMGGSSLAPEVFQKIFGSQDGYLSLSVLDSTDPATVANFQESLDLSKTLFIVATKSGGTVETLSFFKYFYTAVKEHTNGKDPGDQFVAITDPDSKLEIMAKDLNFREIFLNNPNIGGRYSALSFFGLVPAALIGVDISQLLERAQKASSLCISRVEDNQAMALGISLAELSLAKIDKLTLAFSHSLSSFGDWIEQLIAESTGKASKGIVPVVEDELGEPNIYGEDRIFVYFHLNNEQSKKKNLQNLIRQGFPVIEIQLDDIFDLGSQMFTWEFATAIAGYRMKINPFDQPNVESAKALARQMLIDYSSPGNIITNDSRTIGIDPLIEFLQKAQSGNYVAIQAYITPSEGIAAELKELQKTIRNRYKVATTLGFGPRFLHSTGQLHKGDGGGGLFIQIISESKKDVPIPDIPGEDTSSITFDMLKKAQALGDAKALKNAGRKVLTFSITKDQEPSKSIRELIKGLS
jgi:glucose-6-phosphate isomerase